jgi:hypothetical protein
LSIWATMLSTRFLRSGCPCGSKPRCDTLAARKREADAFLQAATQAPQAIQAAAAKEASAFSFSTATELPSTAFPVLMEINPRPAPAGQRLSGRYQVFYDGKPLARQGSTTMVSPSL